MESSNNGRLRGSPQKQKGKIKKIFTERALDTGNKGKDRKKKASGLPQKAKKSSSVNCKNPGQKRKES